jgi:hypothetical protein
MAIIHHTALKPAKLELLTAWLPSRPWYRGPREPELVKAGGFRLDDPRGVVGIEFMVVTETGGAHPAGYLVPLSYRGAPLDGAEHALVGTMEHGALGRRWAYDGCHDAVLVAQLLALVEGRAQAQDQNTSDTPDLAVTRSYRGAGLVPADPVEVTDDREGTELRVSQDMTLRLRRLLRAAAPDDAPGAPDDAPPGAAGHVAGAWRTPDGSRTRGLFAVLHPHTP